MLSVCYVTKEMGGGLARVRRQVVAPTLVSGQAVPVGFMSSRYGVPATVSRSPTRFVESRQGDRFVDSNSMRARALVFPRVEKRREVRKCLRWKRRQ